MVNKISRIFSIFFLVFFFCACSSGGKNTSDGIEDSDFVPEVSDEASDSAADEETPETNDGETAETDAAGDEEPDAEIEDTEPVSDEDADSSEDSDMISGDDADAGSEDTDETDDSEIETDDFDGETLHLRIVAGNITSGNQQSYDPGEGIRILQALKPDIALVQEMNYKNNSASDYKNFAQQTVGTDYYAVDSADYQIPNGIVSKYPIKSKGYWKDPNITNRALLWAIVDIPGETDIFAVSVHLHTSPAADQTEAALVIVDEIAKVKSADPGKYYYVVGGDFNGKTAVSSSGFGKNNTFYVNGPHPVDENGDEETNATGSKQYDFVLADYPLHEFQVPVVYTSTKDSTKTKTYNNGLVFDTRVYTQSVLDEYFPPAKTSDSSASQMQHMAVVKDFLIELR